MTTRADSLEAIPDDYTSLVKSDTRLVASWSYSDQNRTMISYDSPEMARLKAQYILDEGLGGAMWWEISGDKPSGNNESLIDSVLDVFGSTK